MTEAAKAAASIRRELKIAFPNITFSVTSQNYSNGNSVDIRYFDGVPTKDVERITNKYQYGHFDGMFDIYEQSNVRKDIPQAKYVHVSRSISEDVRAAKKQEIAQYWGIEDVNSEQEWYSKTGMWSDMKIYKELVEVSL